MSRAYRMANLLCRAGWWLVVGICIAAALR